MNASACSFQPLAEAYLPEGFCAGILPVDLSQPRSIVTSNSGGGNSGFLALERGTNSVVAVQDLDGNGIPESRKVVVTGPGLNHGLAVTSTHLYASQSTHVYRWPYDSSTMSVTGDQEVVIENINADGQGGAPFGHTTRTLAIADDELTIYVSVGSNGNIDADSFRSRIRRFSLADPDLFPLDFTEGEVFVDGLRNEVALTFDLNGVLWGAGNSADWLFRSDLGGDIHNDNPAEELHKLIGGQNYGYPFCWREYELELGLGRGTAWAWPSTIDVVTDDQCRTEFDTPIFTLQAHSAPLGIEFYKYPDVLCDGVNPFPRDMDGFVFIAYHGSWNRDIPTGYKVVYIEMNGGGDLIGDAVDLLAHSGTGARWSQGVRPVDVAFDECGRLLVTSDGTRTDGLFAGDMVIRIESTVGVVTKRPTRAPMESTIAPAGLTTAPTETAVASTEPTTTGDSSLSSSFDLVRAGPFVTLWVLLLTL